eukprot:scaffold3353_cov144-Skeletonema_menzelii.AAC.23
MKAQLFATAALVLLNAIPGALSAKAQLRGVILTTDFEDQLLDSYGSKDEDLSGSGAGDYETEPYDEEFDSPEAFKMELSEEDFGYCPAIREPTGCHFAGCRWNGPRNGGNCQASGSGSGPPPRVPREPCSTYSFWWGQPGCNAHPYCRWNGRNNQCVPTAYYSEDEDFDSQDFDLAAADYDEENEA